jgi:hypothetical protein
MDVLTLSLFVDGEGAQDYSLKTDTFLLSDKCVAGFQSTSKQVPAILGEHHDSCDDKHRNECKGGFRAAGHATSPSS